MYSGNQKVGISTESKHDESIDALNTAMQNMKLPTKSKMDKSSDFVDQLIAVNKEVQTINQKIGKAFKDLESVAALVKSNLSDFVNKFDDYCRTFKEVSQQMESTATKQKLVVPVLSQDIKNEIDQFPAEAKARTLDVYNTTRAGLDTLTRNFEKLTGGFNHLINQRNLLIARIKNKSSAQVQPVNASSLPSSSYSAAKPQQPAAQASSVANVSSKPSNGSQR